MKFSTFTTLFSFAALAMAMPAVELEERNGGGSAAACSNAGGTQACCNQVTAPSNLPSGEQGGEQGLLSQLLGPITATVGIACNPISVLAIPILGQSGCKANTVCCQTSPSSQTNNGISILNGAQIPICNVLAL